MSLPITAPTFFPLPGLQTLMGMWLQFQMETAPIGTTNLASRACTGHSRDPSSLVIPWPLAQSIPAGGVHTLSFFQTPLGLFLAGLGTVNYTMCKGTLSILWKEHQQLLLPEQEQGRAGDSLVLEAKTKKKPRPGLQSQPRQSWPPGLLPP